MSERITITLSEEMSDKLNQFALENGVTEVLEGFVEFSINQEMIRMQNYKIYCMTKENFAEERYQISYKRFMRNRYERK